VSPTLACLALLASGAALVSCGKGGAARAEAAGAGGKDEPEAIPVDTAAAARGAIAGYYASSATLRPRAAATVTARTRGVIERLAVEEGADVEEDQPLAWLEDGEQRLAAERTLRAAELEGRDFARAEQLHSQGLLSDEAWELARREATDAQAAAAEAELQLSRTVLRAPFPGRILERHVHVGTTVSDGTAVYDLADLTPLEADVSVPERHVARLAVGQAAWLVADATGQRVAGRIERIAPDVEATTGTVKVTVSIAEADGLRPGSFARVEVVTETRDQALLVPRSALVADGRKWTLFRVDAGRAIAERVEVRLGLEDGERVEIQPVEGAERAVAEGDLVVTSGAAALSDGAPVRLPEPRGEPESDRESSEGVARADGSAGGRS
jgi:RND family efflux transporter MFP subunit